MQIEDRAMHNLDELGRLGEWQRVERLIHSRAWQNMLKRFGPPVKPADIRCDLAGAGVFSTAPC